MDNLKDNNRMLERSRKIVNSGSWVWHTGTNELEMSDEMYQILGLNKEDGIPQIDVNVKYVHPDDRKRIKDVITKVLKNGTSYNIDYRIIRADNGEERHLHLETEFEKTPSSNDLMVYGFVQDITEQKKSENRYQQFFDDDLSGVFISTPQGKLIDCNNAFLDIFGFSTKKSALQQNTKELYPDTDYREEKLKKIIKSKKLVNYEEKLHKVTGEEIHVISNIIGEFDGDNLIYLRGSTIDITDRKKAEDALREKSESFRAIVDTTQEWIWSINLQGVHTYSNPAVKNILGYPPEKLVGKPSFDLMHEEDSQLIATKLPLWIAEKRGWKSLVIRWRHKNGSWRFLESSAVPIINANGEIAGFRGVDRDVTERKLTEEALKNSEKKFKILFGAAPDAYYLSDLKGNFIDGNEAAVGLMGYSKEELIGKSFLKLKILSSKEILKASKLLMENTQGKGTGPDEFILNCKDGSQISVEIRTYPVKIKDETVVLGIARDITERKRAEKGLRISEEKFSKAFQNSPIPIYISTISEGEIITINPVFEKLSGFKRNELIGKTSLELGFYEKPKDRNKLFQQLQKDGKLYDYEIFFRRKSGESRLCRIYSEIIEIQAKACLLTMILDVTEREKGARALTESERQNKALLNATSDMAMLIYKNGKIITTNNAMAKKFGQTSDKMVNKNIFELLPTDLAKQRKEQGENAEKLGTVVRFVDRRANLWLDNSIYPIFDEKGKLLQYAIFSHDITKLKQAEEEKRKLSVAMEQSPVSVMITDTDGIIEYVNPTYEKLTGYTTEETIGKNPRILKSEIKSDKDYRKLWETISQGKVWAGEFLNKKKNGELYWESATISPVLDSNNNITHFLAVKEDITEKKKFITDLMDREEKYRTLTYNLNVGVYRNTTGKNGRFIEVNPAFLKMFGFRSKNELERWKVVDLYSDPIERKSVDEKLASKGFLINEEIKMRKKDGTRFTASISATAAKDKSGKIIHYDGIIEDVTEEKKAREDILTYQSNLKSLTNELLVTEEEAKRRLAITLHDKLLQSLVLANFKSIELNKKIEKSAHKKLISEISGFIEDAIKESRDITYELSPPVLYEMGLIPAISWKLEEMEKNHKIKTLLTDYSNSYEFDEKGQTILYRTISELLHNVIKHSKAKNVNVSFNQFTNDYRITISDNGSGFDLETIREKAVEQKKFGLFSIMERIRFIGGEVNIDTAPNKGTKIIINLPIKN